MPKINWQSVESSNIGAVAFDDKSQTICVKFNNGGLYSYIGGNEELFLNFVNANSVGKYLNNVVKALPYTRWETEEDLITHLNIAHHR